MKILFLIHTPPPIHGSSLVGQQVLLSKAINSNFDIEYINLLASQKVRETGRIDGKKFISFFFIILDLLQKMIFYHPRICYFALTTTGLAFYRDAILVSILNFFRVPIIFHLHNKGVRNNAKNRLKRFIYKLVFEKSEVILLSDLLYNDIEQIVKKEQVHICPNGIVRNTINKNEKEYPVILFLSNLIRSKGVLDLIEACRILKNRNIDYKLNIVGNEGDIFVDELKKVVNSYGLSNNVFVLGPQYMNEKVKSFQSSSVFVFPTFYSNECFPLVLLEAMQASLPIISTFEGGIPDIVLDGETGFLVPQRDIQALADRLQELLENPALCEKMGEAGRKRFEQNYTAEIFENRLLDILKTFSLKYS